MALVAGGIDEHPDVTGGIDVPDLVALVSAEEVTAGVEHRHPADLVKTGGGGTGSVSAFRFLPVAGDPGLAAAGLDPPDLVVKAIGHEEAARGL